MSNFKGAERRRHRLVVTRNTEYHLRDGVVVAVRDRQSKRWCEGHIAVDLRLQGGVRFFDNGAVIPSLEEPKPGDAMFFSYRSEGGDERQLVTSRIEAIDRPAKRDVLAYATLGVRKSPASKKASSARAMS
jgi:hypothetical protein